MSDHAPLIVAAAIIVVAALAGHVASTAQVSQPVCGDELMQEQARKVMRDGVDRAMRDHVARLYGSWMRDDHDQPRRASQGIYQGINAFVHGHNAVANWRLPPC